MIYTKGLLLKGLLGFGAASSAVYVGLSHQERIAEFFSGGKETAKPEAVIEEASKLLDEVGLSCDLANATATTGVDCSKKTGEGAKIKVKQGDKTFDLSDITSPGKIKVYKDDGYDNKFKFVIEDGDISQSNDKLEQFETYEIKKKDNTKEHYLTRKYKSSEAKRRLLGLPDSCEFPETAGQTKTCNLTTTEDINKIKFDGKTNVSLSGGSVSLKVEVTPSTETSDFPHGFKFTLTPSGGSLTINRSGGNITIADGKATEFKIKKTGSSLSLEEALTKDVLTAKVGLTCTGTPNGTTGIDCTKGEGNIKVKKDTSTSFELSSLGNSGKIKLYKAEGSEDYNGGLKFVIEEGDITGNNSDKLEEFETYEIKQDGADWKLNRKKKSWEEKRRILGLPEDCIFPEGSTTSKECTVKSANINNIKFDGKSSATITENGTLKITVATSDEATDFPDGYKFTLTPNSGTLTIAKSSGNAITVNANEDKEFKIKRDSQKGKNLTLEEAWTLETLTKKVNLSCAGANNTPTESAGVDCSKTASSGNIKVNKGGTTFELSDLGSAGKIKVYKTSAGETHNHGFKFVIEENDISGTSGGSSGNKLEQFETYEIKKDGTDWKLNRKSEAKDGIKKALGLDECTFPTNGAEQECALDESKFKKINFDGKSVNDMTGGNSAKLKISKPSNNNDYGSFGYKFKLESEQEAKISSSLTIKANTNTEFKIKKGTGNSITLEKAWTAKSLGEKVGLECPEDNDSNKECTLQTSKVNLKVDGNKKFTSLSKKSNGDGGEKKVKFEVGEAEYNQGFKFTAESEICLQNGNNGGTDDDKKIEAKGGSGSEVSYEIKEDGGTWYLTKKSNASRT